MALKLYNETDIEAIADAIRAKNGSSDTYKVSEMADAIDDIPTGGGSVDYTDQDWPAGAITSNITQFKNYNGQNAFYGRSGITSITLPNLTLFGSSTFAGIPNVTRINLPNANVVDYSNGLFISCPKLELIVLPKVTNAIWNGSFRYDSALEIADLVTRSLPQGEHFRDCPSFKTLILRHNDVCALGNVSAFTNSPFASNGTGGTLYVPQSLISSYQSATNWSTILGYANNQIKAIEGSIYETQYADGTSISS